MRVTLVLTHQCNLACSYCYAGDKFDQAMPDEVAWRALALGAGSGERIEVAFFGGEPMLAFPAMARWTRVAAGMARRSGREVEFSVTTNGTIMGEKHVAFFKHYRFHVAISVDGVDQEHDRYRPFVGGRGSSRVVWKGIERAAPVLERLSVLMVLNPDTVGGVCKAVRRAHEMGVARVLLVPNLDVPWSPESREVAREVYGELARWYVRLRVADLPLYVHPFVDLMRRRLNGGAGGGCSGGRSACGFGVDEVAVAPSGRMYPCARLVATDTRADIRVGSVYDGVSMDRVRAVRGEALARQAACGSRGECLCVPMMPGDAARSMGTLGFFEALVESSLDAAMTPTEVLC